MNLRELHQIHRRHLTAMRRSPETLRFYTAAVGRWAEFLTATGREDDPAQVMRADLQAFQLWLREQGLGAGGEHALLRGLRATFRWAQEEELIPTDPFKKLKMPSLPKETPPTVQPDEVAAMLKAARAGPQVLRDVAVLMTLFDTGLRMGELIGLRAGDVDMVSGRITVRPAVAKREKGRVVPVGIKTAKAIAAYERKARKPARSDLQTLFLSREGLPLTRSGLTQLTVRLGTVAGLPRSHVAPHAFRRGFAVQFLRSGGDLFALQHILGHSSLQMTKRYVSYLPDDLQRQHMLASPVDRL